MTSTDRLDSVWFSRQEAVLVLGVALIAFVSLTIAGSRGSWLYPSIYFGAMVLAFIIGAIVTDLRPIWLGAAIAVALGTVGLVLFPENFSSPNVLACGIVLTLVAASVYQIWWFIPFGLAGLFATQSRTAWLGIAAAAFAALWNRSRIIAVWVLIAALVFGATIKNDLDASFLSRIGIWQDTINHMTPFGHGFGSFFEEYSRFAVRTNMFQLAPAAYNDFLQIVFELGFGSVLAVAFAVACLDRARGPQTLILIAYAAMSLTFFPLYIPIIGHLVALTLGHLAFQRRL
jgi:hypothetical protein